MRPGLSSTGGLLLPLQKGRANEQAPTFVVELMYLQRVEGWSEIARERLVDSRPKLRFADDFGTVPAKNMDICRVFAQSQPEGGNAEAEANPQSEKTVDADVVDAEFEEVKSDKK